MEENNARLTSQALEDSETYIASPSGKCLRNKKGDSSVVRSPESPFDKSHWRCHAATALAAHGGIQEVTLTGADGVAHGLSKTGIVRLWRHGTGFRSPVPLLAWDQDHG